MPKLQKRCQKFRVTENALNPADVDPEVLLVGCYDFPDPVRFRYEIYSHSMLLVQEGMVEASTMYGNFSATTGDLLCFRPAKINEFATIGPTRFMQLTLHFGSGVNRKKTPLLGETGCIPVHLSLGSQFPQVRMLFEELCLVVGMDSALGAFRSKALVFEILALIVRTVEPELVSDGSLDRWRKAQLLLEHSSTNHLSIQAIAKMLMISPQYLVNQFKNEFKITPKQYQIQCRLREAAHLLGGTDLSLKDIAYRLHFSDPKAFSKSFKFMTGVAPSAYRKRPQNRTDWLSPHKMIRLNRHIIPPGKGPNWQNIGKPDNLPFPKDPLDARSWISK